MIRWPHQTYGAEQVVASVLAGDDPCCTSPTGGGKSLVMADSSKALVEMGKKVALFVNRKILTHQMSHTLYREGIEHGVVASGWLPHFSPDVQLCSLQTVSRRVGSGKLDLPQADVVMFDEGHNHGAQVHEIVNQYKEAGARCVFFTATPVSMAGLATKLIVAGTNSELRKIGALVPCDVFAPSEPDMKGVKKNKVGEYVQAGMVKRVMQTIVFADVFKQWMKHNPHQHHTLLFAPDVAASVWFTEEFSKRGVPALHIDGNTDDEDRAEAFRLSQSGDVPVICSCGVLREGFNAPWIRYGILVQVCGALSTYLQVVGRLLRAHPGKERCTLQDHSGCWWRHGSPNDDREWTLGCTDIGFAKARKASLERGETPEGICCPECGGVRKAGPDCHYCGHKHTRSVRKVRMVDGQLVRMVGSVTKKKTELSSDQKTWNGCLAAAYYSGMTVAQAAGHFKTKTGQELPNDLFRVPPRGSVDWNRRVRDVYPTCAGRRKAKV